MQKNLTPKWTDLRVSLEQTRINPATSKPDYGTFLGNTKIYLFDPTTAEGVTFSVQMPHEYKLESKLKPHVHFVPTTTNTGTVRFGLEYTSADMATTFPVTKTIYTDAVACSGIANRHQVVSFPEIDGFNRLSGMMSCYLFRDATNDTYTGDCGVLEFDIHYQQDGFGSKTETLKD
jgi:hypothetical protein